MEEIYGEKGAPVARETNYYETQRNKREDNFAPSYQETYKRQQYNDDTFNRHAGGGGGGKKYYFFLEKSIFQFWQFLEIYFRQLKKYTISLL